MSAGERRLRKVPVALSVFAEMLLGTRARPRWTDAPADALVISAEQEPWVSSDLREPSRIYFMVHSEAFDVVPEHEHPPEVVVTYSDADECPEGMRAVG